MSHKCDLLTTVNSNPCAAALSLSSYCSVPEKPSDSMNVMHINAITPVVSSAVVTAKWAIVEGVVAESLWRCASLCSKSFILPVNTTKAYLQKNFPKSAVRGFKNRWLSVIVKPNKKGKDAFSNLAALQFSYNSSHLSPPSPPPIWRIWEGRKREGGVDGESSFQANPVSSP